MYKLRVCTLSLESEYLPPSFEGFLCECEKPQLSIKISAFEFEPECEAETVLPQFSVYRRDGAWLLETNKSEQLLIKPDYSEAFFYIPDKHAEELDVRLTLLMRIVIECRLSFEGFVSLHSACVAKDEKAFAFTGVSGMGKSTRAQIWHEELGALWISGDRPLVDTKNAVAFGAPWDGKEQYFNNVSYPLEFILDVRRSEKTQVRKLSRAQALRVLMQQCFIPMWDSDVASIVMTNIYSLAKNVPMLRLGCDRTPESAREVFEILSKEQDKIHKEDLDMKIKDGFTLRKVAGEFMVMPTGANVAKFEGSMALNEVSAFIYEKLTSPISEEELLNAITEEYDVDREDAKRDLSAVLEAFRSYGVLDEQE